MGRCRLANALSWARGLFLSANSAAKPPSQPVGSLAKIAGLKRCSKIVEGILAPSGPWGDMIDMQLHLGRLTAAILASETVPPQHLKSETIADRLFKFPSSGSGCALGLDLPLDILTT